MLFRSRARFLEEHPNYSKEFGRLKGLGEMDWQELKATTIDPARRSLLQVTLEDASIADDLCSVLMGEDVAKRREFIQTHATDTRFLDI